MNTYRKFMFLISILAMVCSFTIVLWMMLVIMTGTGNESTCFLPSLGSGIILTIALIALAIKRLGWNEMVDNQILMIEDVVDQMVGEVQAFEAAAPTLAGGIVGFVVGGVPGAIVGAIITTPSEEKTE